MTIANSLVLSDNAYGTIASGLAVGDTALSFTTGHGARFPVVAAGQVLYCCILNSTNILEEVQITAHASGSDSATIVRAAGSTTAKVWTAGDRIEARVSSTVLKRLQDEALKKITLTTSDAGATYTGAMQVPGLGYITGLVYPMTLSTSNSGTAPTIALDGLSAVTVKLNNGSALAVGHMPLNGLYSFDGTNFLLLNPKFVQPTRQVLTSGSGATYTTPTGATRINVRMVGGGAGGGGASANNGTTGNNTTFSTLTASGGASGLGNGSAGGAGGAASGGDVNIPGGGGGGGGTSNVVGVAFAGGNGGNSAFGGGANGVVNATGTNGATNSGGGGSGGGGGSATNSGSGGGAGGYVEKRITSPAATYTYTVGAAASGAAAGGAAGGDGAAGIIIVDEYYD